MEHAAPIILYIGLTIFVSHFFTSLFEKTRIPDVLLLIIIGIVAGQLFDLNSETFGDYGLLLIIDRPNNIRGYKQFFIDACGII